MRLRLGRGDVELSADVVASLQAIVPVPAGSRGGGDTALRAAAGEFVERSGARALVERSGARAGERVLLAVPDRTRPLALAPLLDAVGAALAECGVGAADVTLAIASGSHAASPADSAPARLGAWARGTRLLAHRPDHATAYAGRTDAGTEVHVHPALFEAGTVLALGATAFHYFAGFGGGPKMLFPGLGARASIAANHRLALAPGPPGGLRAGVEPGRLEGNAVAEDLAAVARLLPPATHLTTWSDEPGDVVAWRERAEFVALTERFAAPRRVGRARSWDTVIASAGGHPRDVDVVQAHKALFHAALYARDGAAIVLLADCEEGIGSRPLEAWLAIGDGAERAARARAAYDLNAQTAISLAAIAARCRVTWVGAGVPPALEGLGIARAREPRAAIASALAAAATGAPAALLPVAGDVVPALPA